MISKYVEIPIEAIQCRPQVREKFDEEAIASLARTIAEVGLQQPITVRRDGNEWVLFNGEMRLRAAKLAGEKKIRALVEDAELSPADTSLRQLISNQHVELLPAEKARAIDGIMREAGWSASQVAVKLGISPGTVTKLLSVLTLPQEIQDRVGSPGLGLSAAYQISLAGNAEAQARMADELASGTLTRDDAAARTRVRKSRRRPSAKRERSQVGRNRVAIALGDKRVVTIAGPGLTLTSIIEWMSGLLDRLRGAADQNVDLSEAVKLASGA